MKISIITTAFNSAETIGDTLASVAAQRYKNIEHLLIDGRSTDNTLAIAKNFPHLAKCVSEKDDGLYHAMNKGLQMASGDVIGTLNSDDIYADDSVLQRIAEAFSHPETDCVYGDLQYVHRSNMHKVVRTWKAGHFNPKNFLYGWMPPHPTFFARKSVYDKTGYFNTELKSAADYELMLRILYKYNYKAVYLPHVLVKMRSGGVSNASLGNRFRANREDARAWKLIDEKPHFFTVYLKPLRKIPQFLNR